MINFTAEQKNILAKDILSIVFTKYEDHRDVGGTLFEWHEKVHFSPSTNKIIMSLVSKIKTDSSFFHLMPVLFITESTLIFHAKHKISKELFSIVLNYDLSF